MKYRNEEDKCYGVAGMAIGLSVFDADDLMTEVNIDADGIDCVRFVPDFYFTGSPRIPASKSWHHIYAHYQVSMGLAIANAIVVNQNYPLLDSYKSTVGKHYDAEVANMDFDDISGSTKKINKWCSDHTNGLITEIIKNVNPEMLAYLLNAMYFKSEWKQKFPKGNTSNETFTAEDGTKKSVPMMKMEKSFTYQDNDVLRTVRLPYGNGVFSMMVILPAEGKTLADVTGYLNGKEWNAFVSNLVSCDVDLWLPKFETQFRIKLNDILCAMGMPTAFDKNLADFTAMSSISPYLSYVQQDAIIKVDEEGTEAAVVSSAGMMPTSAGPGDHIVFHADHPFLYLITESSTGAILFAGKYSGK